MERFLTNALVVDRATSAATASEQALNFAGGVNAILARVVDSIDNEHNKAELAQLYGALYLCEQIEKLTEHARTLLDLQQSNPLGHVIAAAGELSLENLRAAQQYIGAMVSAGLNIDAQSLRDSSDEKLRQLWEPRKPDDTKGGAKHD